MSILILWNSEMFSHNLVNAGWILTSQSKLLSTFWVYKPSWVRSFHSKTHCKCQSEVESSRWKESVRSTSVREKNKTFFIRVWKSLHSGCVLKTLRESSKRTISTSSGLGFLPMVSKPGSGWYANKEAKPRRGDGHKVVCQQGHWISKGGGLEVPHRLKKGTSASEDAGPRRGWIVRSHIVWRGEQSIFIMVWKPLPSRHVLKNFEGKSINIY